MEVLCYCPQCNKPLIGAIVVDQSVWLKRLCPEHGPIKSKLYSDPSYFAQSSSLSNSDSRCLVVEVTERCDVGCSTCSASSNQRGVDKPIGSIVSEIQAAKADIQVETVALSGGEPLMRHDIIDVIDEVHKSASSVVLITSGRKFESNLKLLDELGKRSDWLEIYLQFDSLNDAVLQGLRTPETNSTLRKLRLSNAISAGSKVTCVCVVCPGFNLEEVGYLANYVRDQGAVGITYQPLRNLGRYPITPGEEVTVDQIQTTALAALSSIQSVKPFQSQPLDIALNWCDSSDVSTDNSFFKTGYTPSEFRVATSSYWDANNYFEFINQTSRAYYFATVHKGQVISLNSYYLDQTLLASQQLEIAK